MGEKIRDLQSFQINHKEFVLELNEGQADRREYDIHIESDRFRFQMTDSEYMKFVAAILEAKRKLIYTKKL